MVAYHTHGLKMTDEINFSTERLEFKPFAEDHLPALQSCLNHPELAGRRFLPRGFSEELPLSKTQVENLLKKWGEKQDGFVYAVILQENQELIGYVQADWGWDPISPGISIVISPEQQRCGYGSEALNLMLHYLYSYTVAHNVSGWMGDWNQPARAFATKHGFHEVGHEHYSGVRDGAYYGYITVDILRPEWQALKGGR
jgi:RimJ/RimL family protein N-acetyltransferase